MKHFLYISCLLLVACQSRKASPDNQFNQSMSEVMSSMKTYTTGIIEQMPDSLHDYKPVAEVSTFREQVQHTMTTLYFLFHFYIEEKPYADITEARQEAFDYAVTDDMDSLKTKFEALFDEVSEFYQKASPEQYQRKIKFFRNGEWEETDYFKISMLLRDHITHHRGQLIIYLREKGIEPVPYVQF